MVGLLSFSNNPPGFDIVLCAGQSNMAGGNANTVILDPTPNSLKQYSCDSTSTNYETIMTGSDPLEMTGGTVANSIGPAHSFGVQYLLNNPTRQALLVPVAVGSTALVGGDWAVGGALYANAIAKANLAIAAIIAIQPSSRFVGVGWLQGENDSNGTTQAVYAAALDAMIAGFRANITGAVNSWFAVLSMAPGFVAGTPNAVPIQAAHVDTPNRNAHCVFIQGPSGMDGGLHYFATGQRILGPAWANAVIGV